MSITRDEFDALAQRVLALESLSERTWSLIGHLDTSLREVHAKLATHDERFDNVERRLDNVTFKLAHHNDRFDNIDRQLDEVIRRLS